MVATIDKTLRYVLLFFLGVAWTCFPLSATADDILGRVLDAESLSDTKPRKIEGLTVRLYFIAADGTEDQNVKAILDETDKNGEFRIEVPEALESRPFALTLYKPGTARERRYGPKPLGPFCQVGPQQPMLAFYNIALFEFGTDSITRANDRLKTIESLATVAVDANDIIFEYASYLKDTLEKYHDEPELDSSTLARVFSLMQRRNDVTISSGRVWTGSTLAKLAVSDLEVPEETEETIRIKQKPPLFPSIKYDHGISLSPWEDGVVVHCSGGQRNGIAKFDGLNGEFKTIWHMRGATNIEERLEDRVVAIGNADGTLVVKESHDSTKSLRLEVGPSLVMVSELSEDGGLLAAITMDGTYKVWKINRRPAVDVKQLAAGRINRMFPRAMTFLSKNELLVGTGLRDVEGSITTLNFKNGVENVTDVESAVTRFLPYLEGQYLAVGGNAVRVINRPTESVGGVKIEYSIKGIEAIDASIEEQVVAVKPKSTSDLILARLRDLFDDKTLAELNLPGVTVEKSVEQ